VVAFDGPFFFKALTIASKSNSNGFFSTTLVGAYGAGLVVLGFELLFTGVGVICFVYTGVTFFSFTTTVAFEGITFAFSTLISLAFA
jgi:hypothetical protein